MSNAACLIHYDRIIPNPVSSHLISDIQKLPGKNEEIILSEDTLCRHDFRAAMPHVSPLNNLLPLSYAPENSWKVPGNELLTGVLPYIDGTLRVSH